MNDDKDQEELSMIGISERTIKRLNNIGIVTFNDLVCADKESLSKIGRRGLEDIVESLKRKDL